MSLQSSWFTSPEQRSNRSGRLRSACDTCHQGKNRCSGGNPCSACRTSGIRCIYSPGSRLGRPKGSKNKRTLMTGNQNEQSENTEMQEDRSGNPRSEVVAWTDEQGQRSDATLVDFDIDSLYQSTFGLDSTVDSSTPFPVDPSLAFIFDTTGKDHLSATTEDEFGPFFGQVSHHSSKTEKPSCI